MLISINGPIPGRLTLVAALESYVALVRSAGWTPPTRDVAKVMHFASGYEHTPSEADLAAYTDEDIARFYRQRVIANVSGYATFLISYIRERLSLLDNLPQDRQAITINTEKAPRFFYNLGRDVAEDITSMIVNYQSMPQGLDYLTLNRIFAKIEAQAIVTMGNDGSIAPNPRCDSVVRSFLDAHDTIMAALMKEEERLFSALGDYLNVLLCMVRLYFGAINQRDNEIYTQDVPSIKSVGLRVGTDVVVSLPAPTFQMLEAYQSKTASVISQEAVRYVDTLNDYYLIRQ